jgi:hypothetical protein
LGFQCVPALFLAIFIQFLPDSPRFLASVGRHEEALEVLQHVRGKPDGDSEVEREYHEIVKVSQGAKKSTPIEFAKILFALDHGHDSPHLTRRAWLCLWLQIMASWTGITGKPPAAPTSKAISLLIQSPIAVTAYSPVLLSQAGYSSLKQNGLAGGLNTIGIVGTIISAQIVDRWGRRRCMMIGSVGLCIVNTVAGALYEASRKDPSKATTVAPAAVTMLFLFNLIYVSFAVTDLSQL